MKNTLRYSIVRSKEELEGSRRLVLEEYIRSGYVSGQDIASGLKMGDYLGLPDTTTFILQYQDCVIGTVSLVEDGEKGVPMDDLYTKEINILRHRGSKIAEVSQFAIRKDAHIEYSSPDKKRPASYLSVPLLKLTVHYALRQGVDTFCIAVNPKHVMFYKFLGFEQFGEEKSYVSVNGAPAVALVLDLEKITCRDSKLREHLVWSEIFSDNPESGVFDKGGTACLEYDTV